MSVLSSITKLEFKWPQARSEFGWSRKSYLRGLEGSDSELKNRLGLSFLLVRVRPHGMTFLAYTCDFEEADIASLYDGIQVHNP